MINPIRHRNLLHWFKRESVSAVKINNYLCTYPQTNRNVGSLPFDWVKAFPKNERAKITQLVQDVFTAFSKDTAKVRGVGRFTGYSKVEKSEFVPAHKTLIDKLKAILKRDDIAVEHVGSGSLKNCHRIDVGDYSYALSTFRAPSVTKSGFGSYYKEGHGRGYEPQNAFTAYKKCSHGRWTKPFMVRVSDDKDEGGYIFSKFIAEDNKKSPFGYVQKSFDTYFNRDEGGNIINNVNIDIGGCVVNENKVTDSFLKYQCKYFAKMMDNNTFILNNYNAKVVQKDLLEYRQKGIDILADEFVDTLSNVYDDKKMNYAFKMIRSLRKIRKQKECLIKENRYEEVKKRLQEEIDRLYVFDRQKEMPDEFLVKLQLHPRLAVDEIGLSSSSNLDGWMTIYRECAQFINFNNLKNNYTSKDIIEFIENNYENLRMDEDLIWRFKKTFDIEKELEIMENKYIML